MDLGLDDVEVSSGIWAGLRLCPCCACWRWEVADHRYLCTLSGGWLRLDCPYSTELVAAIKMLHPRFRSWRGWWLISPHPTQLRYVVSEILKPFGFLISSEIVEQIVRRKCQ